MKPLKTKTPRYPRLSRIGIATLLPALIAVGQAHAAAEDLVGVDTDDTFSITPKVAYFHDDNLFRLPSSANENALLGKSTRSEDFVVSTLAFKINKPYSLQRFELDADVTNHRFRNFDYLNFTAINYAAAWRWSLTPSLRGNLMSSRKQELNSFIDYTDYGTRNLRTRKRHRFDAAFDVSGSWRLLGGVEQITHTNSEFFAEEADERLRNAEVGVGYELRSGTMLSLVSRTGRGDYFEQSSPDPVSLVDNKFEQRENEARLVWAITGKTSLDARLGHLERTHDNFGQRDFSGTVGKVLVKWGITEKTSLTAEVARELNSFQSEASSYVSADRFSLSPYWQMTAKTALRARYDYVKRDYRGAIVATPASDRVDDLHDAMIALEWQPLRTTLIRASLESARRNSNQPGLDFESRIVGVSAQISF